MAADGADGEQGPRAVLRADSSRSELSVISSEYRRGATRDVDGIPLYDSSAHTAHEGSRQPRRLRSTDPSWHGRTAGAAYAGGSLHGMQRTGSGPFPPRDGGQGLYSGAVTAPGPAVPVAVPVHVVGLQQVCTITTSTTTTNNTAAAAAASGGPEAGTPSLPSADMAASVAVAVEPQGTVTVETSHLAMEAALLVACGAKEQAVAGPQPPSAVGMALLPSSLSPASALGSMWCPPSAWLFFLGERAQGGTYGVGDAAAEWLRKLRGGDDAALGVPHISQLFWTWTGAFLGILLVAGIHHATFADSNFAMVIAPFGASAVLLYGVPESKLAQPRNLVGGMAISSVIGVCIRLALPPPRLYLGSAIGVATALLGMQLTGTTHPPGGEVALLICSQEHLPPWHGLQFVFTTVVGALCLMCVALMTNNWSSRRTYPTFWW